MKKSFRVCYAMLLTVVVILQSCDEEKIVTLSLDSYSFLLDNNSTIEKNRDGIFNSNGDTVTIYIPHFISTSSLIASFEIADGSSAYIEGTKQTSEVTANDFTEIVDYILSAGQGDEYPFAVHCINDLLISVIGHSEDSTRVGAGDFTKEELFKVSNIKNGNWTYTITIEDHTYTDTATSEDNYFIIPNFIDEDDWLSLNSGEDGEISLTLVLTSSSNNISNVEFSVSLSKEQYSIKSWQDLQAINYDLLGDYKVYNNIEFPYPGVDDFSSEGFIPIGDSLERSFKGSLDGQGYVITNFYINRNSQNTRYVGLFGVIERRADILPVIKNLGIEISTRSNKGGVTGGLYAGGLAGWNEGKVINCYVTGGVASIGDISDPGGAGGLIGFNNGGEIERCYSADGRIESTVTAGGLVAENTDEGEISESWASHYVVLTGESGYGNQSVAAGGFAGKNTEEGTIVNCYATGDVTGNESLGGFVGYHTNASTIRTCYATGNVTETDADGSDDIGGFVGEIDGTEERRSITDSYWNQAANPGYDGVGEGETYGVDGRSVLEFQNEEMYVGWDFSETWGINEIYNDGYAYLLDVEGQETTSE